MLGLIGIIGGGIAGFLIAGPLGIVPGVFLGGSAGFVAGLGLGWLACKLVAWLGDLFGGGPAFQVPHFSNVRVVAVPDPARKNVPCRLELRYTVAGNDDNALCTVDWHINAEAGDPADSPPQQPARSNASSFGRAYSFNTTWVQEHDGRRVLGTVIGTAVKNGVTESFDYPVQSITVRVLP
jgi:hypothetical protein